MMSFESTVMSASLPGASEPLRFSSNAAYALFQRVRSQRFLAAHALVGIEHRAVFQLAADGGIEACDRADVFHRRIRAVGHHRAGFHELLPHVGAFFGALADPAAAARTAHRTCNGCPAWPR